MKVKYARPNLKNDVLFVLMEMASLLDFLTRTHTHLDHEQKIVCKITRYALKKLSEKTVCVQTKQTQCTLYTHIHTHTHTHTVLPGGVVQTLTPINPPYLDGTP